MSNTKSDAVKFGYSVREACQATSLGRTKIYALLKSKDLEAIRCGGRTIILAQSIRKLLSVEE